MYIYGFIKNNGKKLDKTYNFHFDIGSYRQVRNKRMNI